MTHQYVRVERAGPRVTITMARPERRNALSRDHLVELTDAVARTASSDATGIILAGDGLVFSAGHDFADMAGATEAEIHDLLEVCTGLMTSLQQSPQVVLARVHGLATAAGCQLVASCDLAVAAESAGFALPGGHGGWFCHTPAVAVARAVGPKRALEMALTGDPIDAVTAADWGLVNRVVPDDQLDRACVALLERASRGSSRSKALGKQTFYAQTDRTRADAYDLAMAVMAQSSQSPEAREGMAAFLEKRAPDFSGR